mgnify:CR=1 FL=1
MTRARDLAKLISGGSTLGGTGELVLKDVDTADGSSPKITFQTGDTDIAANDVLGTIDFQAPDEGTGTDALLVAAGIEAVSEGDFSASSNATKLSFKTGASETATEKMTIKSDGKVGIGIDAPVHNLQIHETATSSQSRIQMTNGDTGATNGDGYAIAMETDGRVYHWLYENAFMQFATNNTERMRIGSSGRIDIATTTNVFSNSSTSGINLFGTNGQMNLSQNGDTAMYVNRNTNDGNVINFYRSAASKGSISVTSSAVSFNTSSDHRLKENVTNVTDGITRVKQLAPKRFNFIEDADTTVDGFLAHEAQAVVPEAVTGTHNEVDEDGNAVMQGIDQSKLVPLLTAALQEAITKIETLETENTAIKARLDALEAD